MILPNVKNSPADKISFQLFIKFARRRVQIVFEGKNLPVPGLFLFKIRRKIKYL